MIVASLTMCVKLRGVWYGPSTSADKTIKNYDRELILPLKIHETKKGVSYSTAMQNRTIDAILASADGVADISGAFFIGSGLGFNQQFLVGFKSIQ